MLAKWEYLEIITTGTVREVNAYLLGTIMQNRPLLVLRLFALGAIREGAKASNTIYGTTRTLTASTAAYASRATNPPIPLRI